MNFQVISTPSQPELQNQYGAILETWPTLEQAQQACNEICQRWGKGQASVKAV